MFVKCPDREADTLRQRIEQARQSSLSPHIKAVNRWHEHLQPFYHFYRQLNLGVDLEKPKRNLLIRIKEMFDAQTFDSSILIFSGPMTPKGGLVVETQTFGVEELVFKDLLSEWLSRTSKQSHLLIILDCNNAGKWIEELESLPERVDSVSILAGAESGQKAAYFELGMWFTFNIMKLLTKNQGDPVTPLAQNPRFSGDYLLCKRETNMYLNFNSWAQIAEVQRSDFAQIEYDNGTYVGHVLGGHKHFWGTFTWKTGPFKGCRYEGEFHKGKLEGRGTLTYSTGRVYVGDFKNNAPDGQAMEQYENGDRYIGSFVKGFKSGAGIYHYANGEIYEGQFAQNKPSGVGRLIISKGAFYEGSFKNGKCNGHGKYKYSNGDVYEGNWTDSIKHGKGVYRYANGDIYEGDFVNGLRSGRGRLTEASGDVYEGGWQNDMKSGEGKYTTVDGETVGLWAGGTLVNQTTFYSKVGTQRIQSGI